MVPVNHTLISLLFNDRKTYMEKTDNLTSTLTMPSSFKVKYLVCRTGVLVSKALKGELVMML